MSLKNGKKIVADSLGAQDLKLMKRNDWFVSEYLIVRGEMFIASTSAAGKCSYKKIYAVYFYD